MARLTVASFVNRVARPETARPHSDHARTRIHTGSVRTSRQGQAGGSRLNLRRQWQRTNATFPHATCRTQGSTGGRRTVSITRYVLSVTVRSRTCEDLVTRSLTVGTSRDDRRAAIDGGGATHGAAHGCDPSSAPVANPGQDGARMGLGVGRVKSEPAGSGGQARRRQSSRAVGETVPFQTGGTTASINL